MSPFPEPGVFEGEKYLSEVPDSLYDAVSWAKTSADGVVCEMRNRQQCLLVDQDTGKRKKNCDIF